MMVKQSSEKQNSKNHNSNVLSDHSLSVPLQSLSEIKMSKKNVKKESVSLKPEFIKKECIVSDIDNVENYSYFEKNTENIENFNERTYKVKKKFQTKLIKEPDENKTEFISDFGKIKLSQTVIVNSVLKVSKIDQNINALLPESLSVIYNKFINSKNYIESLHCKDDFFCGVGLLGVNIEEQIYNKRKALEDSLKRGIRLRPNPKPTKLFDGTIINRPARNYSNVAKSSSKSASRPIVLRGKVKYNLFNIGIDAAKKKNRRNIRKPLKKKLDSNRSMNHKFGMKKEASNQNSASSDEDTEDTNSKSIAFTRPKRQQKVPKLDFKYCYADTMPGRNRKYGDSNSDGAKSIDCGREFMEIIDSDSSSVVEVSPPNDIDLSEESADGLVGKSTREAEKWRTSRCPASSTSNLRRGWRPKESKALNLLDKLRLGLQCTIIQTEHDIIIQNLSLEDLATLQSRLQGLATFKNIEAEYDKNGQETARATIDRKLLNLPLKTSDTSAVDNKTAGGHRKYEDSLKRKLLSSQLVKYQTDRKKVALQDKSTDELTKSLKNHQTGSNSNNNSSINYKPDDCSSPVWIRPKGRSVKKVRKLYTQSGSTPNILSRSQMSNRSDKLMTSSSRSSANQSMAVSKNQSLTFSQASNLGTIDSTGHSQHTTSVSFYSQLSTMASNITAVPVIAKPVMSELVKPVSTITSTSVAVPVSNLDLSLITDSCTSSTSGSTANNSSNNISHNNNGMSSTSSNNNSSTSSNHGTISATVAPVSPDCVKKSISVEKVLAANRVIDLVSPATAMSASQLLMLKRGGAQATTDAGPNSVVNVVNSTDQLYTNQILKPFKKTFITSSPPKLELDDEEMETDFELTPSMITQVKNVSVPINLSNSQSIQNKNNFLSKPLIQSSGILPNSRRTISLTNTPLFQAQNALISTPSQLPTCCVTVSTKSLTVIDKPIVCVVTAQSIALPNADITTTANNNILNPNFTNNQNNSPNQNENVKIKPRKWTHNFHTSNSINFREVLCTSRPNTIQPNLSLQVQLPISNSVNSVPNAKQIGIPSPNTTNIVNTLRSPEKSNQTPSKGSSAVLKSLLVGSNTTNDLCNLNKSANWASKYLSSTSSLQDSSKIKWQVGGTVITSSPSIMSPVSKESIIPLEIVNSSNNK